MIIDHFSMTTLKTGYDLSPGLMEARDGRKTQGIRRSHWQSHTRIPSAKGVIPSLSIETLREPVFQILMSSSGQEIPNNFELSVF